MKRKSRVFPGVLLTTLLLVSLPAALPARAAVADDGVGVGVGIDPNERAALTRNALLDAQEQARAAKQQARAERRTLKQLKRAERRLRRFCPQPVVAASPPGPALIPDDQGRRQAEALARTDQLPLIVLQYALKAIGSYGNRVDGLAGPATTAALKGFQRNLGAPADGTLSSSQTVTLIQMAAARGQAESQNTLGMMLASGIGLPRNDEAAAEWFRRSAGQGNPFGTYNLGVMYRDGRGIAAGPNGAAPPSPDPRVATCLRAEAALKELSR